MFSGLKKQWRTFRAAPPGRRFQDQHEHHREGGFAGTWWGRLLIWIAGIGLMLIGLFLAVAPGPAVIFIVPGAALIASESLTMARLLDWIDRRLAPFFAAVGRIWRRLPKGAQLGVKIVTACGSVTAVVLGFLMMRR